MSTVQRHNDSDAGVLAWTDMRKRPQVSWLVDGVLRRNSIAVLYGDSETGKTFLALDLGLTLASNLPDWHGMTIQHGPVVYVLAEDPQGDFRERGEAWAAEHGVDLEALPFRVVEGAFDLLHADGVNDLRCKVDLAADEMGEQPVYVVLDTFGRCMDAGDEDKNSDVHRAMTALDKVRKQTGGASILLIHHEGKAFMNSQTGRPQKPQKPRGASALENDSTTMLRTTAKSATLDDGRTRLVSTTVTCKRQKGQPHFAPLTFPLHEVAFPAMGQQPAGSSLVIGDTNQPLPSTMPVDTSATAPVGSHRHQEDEVLVGFVKLGRTGPSQFGRALGISRQSASERLKKLEAKGLAQRVGHGLYEPTGFARECCQMSSAA